MRITFRVINIVVDLQIRSNQVTIQDIHAHAVQMGRCHPNGSTNLIHQMAAYRDMMGGKDKISLVDARDYVWKLHGRPIPGKGA